MVTKEVLQQCLVLSEDNGREFHAGSKARNDADQILASFNFPRLINYVNDNQGTAEAKKNLGYHLQRRLDFIKSFRALHACRNKVIFAQYPDYNQGSIKSAITSLFAHNKMVYLVHDVDQLRDLGHRTGELEVLNKAVVLIVHNAAMEKKLKDSGVTKPYFIRLQLFDYLTSKPQTGKQWQKAIVFAGNLGKSLFLPAFMATSFHYDLNLYGNGLTKRQYLPAQVHFCGSYPPETLPGLLTGGFGLVWDGDSITTCQGAMGEYLRYNSPHKFSLYLAAGIPVIVWKEAAVASLVKKYQVGFCVDSLADIEALLAATTADDYAKLCAHVQVLQEKVIRGAYLTAATEAALQYLEEMGIVKC